MASNIDEMRFYFEQLWGGAEQGILALCSIQSGYTRKSFYDLSKSGSLNRACQKSVSRSEKRQNVYQTMGILREIPDRGRGKESDVMGIPGLWMDVDIASGAHAKSDLPETKERALNFIKSFPLPPSMTVFSGGGLHVYWLFKEIWYFDNEIERSEARRLSKQFQLTLASKAKDMHGWNLDMTDDLVRLLRVPGTFNYKKAPVAVSILENGGGRYNPSDFESYLVEASTAATFNNSSPRNLNADILRVIDACAFLRHCRDDAAVLPEPDWFCMIGALCFEGGSRPLIHELSKPYGRYDYNETELKIRNAQDHQTGPTRCDTIRDKTGFECPKGGCNVISPIHLKSRLNAIKNREFFELKVPNSQDTEIKNKINFSHDRTYCELMDNDTGPDNESLPDWPKLNPKALCGFAGKFVEIATRNSEADPAAVLLTFLTRFGVEVGPSPYLMIGDTKHYARINSVIVGNSSKARKGTSGRPVTRLFEFKTFQASVEDGNCAIRPAKHSPGPLSSGEGLIHAVRDATETWQMDKKTGSGEMVVTDPGIEDKRLFILDEEFAAALSCTKREGNTLSTIIRSSWDSGNIDPLTKTSKIKTTGAHIGICTHITLAELGQKLSEVEAFNGFANRFLWVCARRSKYVPFPEPIPNEDLTNLQLELIGIIKATRERAEIKFNDEAKNRWKEVYRDLSRDHDGMVGTIINRAEAQVIRLAMIYCLLDAKTMIERTHLDAAIALWTYCEDSARFIFTDREMNPYLKKIYAALQKRELSKTDMHNLFQRRASKDQLNGVLKELIAKGKVESFRIKTKKRSKTMFRALKLDNAN